MARPTTLDLTAPDHPWRQVPMRAANRGIDVVPLASHPADFVILARFPAGFVRDEPGGYHAAETFLVLDGELELGGRALRRGDLTHVPGETLRTSMSTTDGCTALAWFSGDADFVAPSELGQPTLEVTTVSVLGAAGQLMGTPEASWEVSVAGVSEGVDASLSRWALDASLLAGPVITRRRR